MEAARVCLLGPVVPDVRVALRQVASPPSGACWCGKQETPNTPERVSYQRIKRRAEWRFARGPSDPRGPGLGYKNTGAFFFYALTRFCQAWRENRGLRKRLFFNILGVRPRRCSSRAHPRPRQRVCFSIKRPLGSGAK